MFQPNIYSQDNGLIVTDIIRLIIVIILIFLFCVEILEKRNKYKNIYEVFESKMLLTLLIFLLYFTSFVIKLTTCYKNEEDYIIADGMTYIDTYSISGWFEQVYFVESLLFAIVFVKILNFLRLNDYIKLFFSSIESGLGIFCKYAIFFIVILMGYACIAEIIWGPYVDDFSSFGKSFLQMLLFTMGIKLFNIRIY